MRQILCELGTLWRATTRTQRWLILAGILTFVALRWNGFTAPFDRDEGEYAYAAWMLKHGHLPYENSFLQKPPLIVYTYLIGQSLWGESEVPPRALSTLSLIFSMLLLGAITGRSYGTWAGVTALWIMSSMLTLKILNPYSANTETFMILPLSALMFFHLFGGSQHTLSLWRLAGCCAASSMFFKPISLLPIIFILVVWGNEVKREHGRRSLFQYGNAVMQGGILSSLLLVSPFILSDLGETMVECVISYNLQYVKSLSFGLDPLYSFGGVIIRRWWVLSILLLGFILFRPSRWGYWSLILLLSIVSVYRATSGHYYILLVPALAVISSASLAMILSRVGNRRGGVSSALYGGTIIVVSLIMLLPHIEQFGKTPNELSDWFYSRFNPFPEAVMVGDKLRSASSESDLVFIAGSEPELLFYARRRSPTRFVIMYPLTLSTPSAALYQEEVVNSLTEHPPNFIVVSTSRLSWLEQTDTPPTLKLFLVNMLRKGYQVRGGVRRDDLSWHSVIDEDLLQECSLLVYERTIP